MSDYDNTNSGILGRNERKTEPTHADHTGSINVDGVPYWIDAYVRTRTDGSGKFFSLRVRRKDGAAKPGAKPAQTAEIDDDVPF